ncbi:MAG: LysM peptidoglycan-binding domain-containing protein [Acetatifactor sp.]|nr:LysM peptidoglycan-binding domain-containing protein [Acetatifactor sp.]
MSRITYIRERELRNYQRKLRRQKEIRRMFILTGIAVVLVMAFALSYHALISHANMDLENVSYKYYTSVQIQPGDTLWNLADRYADCEHYASQEQYITEVMNMNHLDGEDIYAGNYLILPYYSTEFIQ